MCYKLGIDVGSTTLKAVVLDHDNQVIYKSYERHFSKVLEKTVEKIRELDRLLEGEHVKAAITGSAGLGVANASGMDFVQEVFATAGSVKQLYPQTDVVIELGGEDAKIIFLQGAIEERMNSTCAGGTGAFIDQMASLLNVSVDEMDALSLKHTDVYPIASRCSVFAKTDVQALLNQGASKENVAASIFGAVVSQTIAGLAQGRPIEGNVLFLGGPLAFLDGLKEQFVKILKLKPGEAIFPELAQYFVALGAAYYAEGLERTYSYRELLSIFENLTDLGDKPQGAEPLFRNEAERQEFIQRHAKAHVEKKSLAGYRGKAYLGIDAGSTTTKVVLMSGEKEILYTYYASNQGSPLSRVQEILNEIYEQGGEGLIIAGSAVTGYGEEIIKNAFDIDLGLVETIAHYTAAKHFNPEVDFIIDIGGQDIKCFDIKDGTINIVMLNEACSSGCGSFLETFAKSLGYDIEEFAKLSLRSEHPVDLGTRCTVFMNSSVKQAQKNGASVEDISAGLALSVVRNAIYKVIRAHSPDDLGRYIVVQGGTFLNDAVLRSFEKLIGREVVRPDIAGLMGAYGAALFAQSHVQGESHTIRKEDLKHFTHTSKVTRCGLCTNHCGLTVSTFANGKKYISGNRCERPLKGAEAKGLPNLYQYKLDKLKEYCHAEGKRGKIGIPLVLNNFENLPFWTTFFRELDFEVLTSDMSSRKLHAAGEHTIPSDTVCYPAKLVHGHIINLLNKGIKTIFYPCMTYNFNENISDNRYNCPVVAYYPEVIEGNVKMPDDVTFLYPYLDLENEKVFIKKIHEFLGRHFDGLSLREVKKAAKAAYTAYYAFKADIAKEGERAFRYAKENGLKTIVLAGRPYHIDAEINHGIDKLISTLGFVILTEDSVAGMGEEQKVSVLNQWTFHARMYRAAEWVTRQKNTQMVQLVSFGCGIDAITTDEVCDILRRKGKLYTQIKIDEINNLGAVKIRLRSLLAAMEEGCD